MSKTYVFIPGVPVAQPRQRVAVIGGAVRNYTPSKHPVNEFKATCKLAWKAQTDGPATQKPLSVGVIFVMPRPQKLLKKSSPEGRIPYSRKPDCDNLVKSVFDALNGVAWLDDSQICKVKIEKWYLCRHEQPGTYLQVEEIKEDGT